MDLVTNPIVTKKKIWWPYERANPNVRKKFHVFILKDAIDAHHISFHNFNCDMRFNFLNIYITPCPNVFLNKYIKMKTKTFCVATLTWSSVGVKPNTWKSGDLESSGTPKCSELDSKGQNTSPWGVLGVIGKVLKLKYLKWPRIGHLDICSPSYGQKKGQESNWQFDS
jgi:hypothetical protein